jgi:hypothetical protein
MQVLQHRPIIQNTLLNSMHIFHVPPQNPNTNFMTFLWVLQWASHCTWNLLFLCKHCTKSFVFLRFYICIVLKSCNISQKNTINIKNAKFKHYINTPHVSGIVKLWLNISIYTISVNHIQPNQINSNME